MFLSSMTRDELDSLLALLPVLVRPAAVVGGYIADFQGLLFPLEEEIIASAVEKRRSEFTAGRTAARAALVAVGGPHCSLGAGERGEPLWPAGFVGSITHSDSLCFAACARAGQLRGIGIDVERTGRMRRELWRMVFSNAEQEALAAMPDADIAATVAFSAKESFHKAHFAACGAIMEFKSMRVELTTKGEGGSFRVSHEHENARFANVPRLVQGRWAHVGDHVFAVCSFE
jgi:enterobactin synthetase component D